MRHLILLPGLYPLTKRAQGDGGRETELLQQTFPASIDSRQPKKLKKVPGGLSVVAAVSATIPHPLTSVSKKRRRALFFLMLLRRTYTATLSARMTMMNRPPMMPAAISGVL